MKSRMLFSLVLLTGVAAAHDLFLVIEGEGAKRKVCARIGEHFPESENAVKVERIRHFMLFQDHHGIALHPVIDDAKKQTCASLVLADAKGGKIVLLSHANRIELSAKEFNAYIEAEGFTHVIAQRKQSGKTGAPGREYYSRYSKAILPGDRDPTKGQGLEIEIVPMKAPDDLKAGDFLPVQVLFRGMPLAGVKVSAAYAGADLSGHTFPVTATTNKFGEAKLKLDRPGLWYVRLIHMLPKKEATRSISDILPGGPVRNGRGPDYDWRSFFATLTFEVSTK